MPHVTHREHTQANLSISQRLRTNSQALRLRRSAFHFIFSFRRPFYRYRQSRTQANQYVNIHGPRGFSAPAHQEPSVRSSAMVSSLLHIMAFISFRSTSCIFLINTCVSIIQFLSCPFTSSLVASYRPTNQFI